MKNYSRLPAVKDVNIELGHFPTAMQALIFRMWEMVPVAKLSEVLETTEENVLKEAERMGLLPQKNIDNWAQKGYITIIKNAWHILPYDQLLTLLGWDEDKLAYCLKEDDGVGYKLGNFKPQCPRVIYRELTDKEKRDTLKIKKIMEEFGSEDCAAPFDFYSKRYAPIKRKGIRTPDKATEITGEWTISNNIKEADFFVDMFIKEMGKQWGVEIKRGRGEKNIEIDVGLKHASGEYHEVKIEENRIKISAVTATGIFRGLCFIEDLAKAAGGLWFKKAHYKRKPQFETRFIYAYSGLYGNVLDEETELSYPDELLYEYARLGINGIWLQGVLYKLFPFPFDPAISAGWEERQKRLQELVKKAGRYGIKVYMYLNEPRSMPESFFERYPNLKGHVDVQFFKGMVALCTGKPEVIGYIKDAVKSICTAVPDIGGFFTITSSEGLTNCYSRVLNKETNCPVCKNRKPEDIISEINNAIAKGAHEVNPDIKITAWTWEWLGRNMDREETDRCILKTDESITVMCTGEEGMEFERGGCHGDIHDYTLSMAGPSERSAYTWAVAKDSGHNTAVKVQINCTWECSTVPFIPVYETITRYMRNLIDKGVNDIMLSWTLGGYPSDNIKVVSGMFFDSKDEMDVLNVLYGNYSGTVKAATDMFCEALREFPFSVETLYRGPQNPGPSNLLYLEPTAFASTQTGYSYDDLEHWYEHGIYSLDVFENQWSLLCEKWKTGFDLLCGLPACDLLDCSTACYYIFQSGLNQIRFIRAREKGDRMKMTEALLSEKECAAGLYKVMLRNPCIGYEAANHYYYNKTQLLEKLLNCEYILNQLV